MPYKYLMYGITGIWFLAEFILGQKTRVKSGESKSQDKYSIQVVVVTISISMYFAVFCGMNQFNPLPIDPYMAAISGLILIVVGILFRWTAIFTLRKYFSVHVRIREDHMVIKTGLYKYIRHPAYTGSLISFFSLGLYLRSIWSVFLLTIPLFLAFLYRMHFEEKALIQALGNDYIEYSKSTKRLIPWVY